MSFALSTASSVQTSPGAVLGHLSAWVGAQPPAVAAPPAGTSSPTAPFFRAWGPRGQGLVLWVSLWVWGLGHTPYPLPEVPLSLAQPGCTPRPALPRAECYLGVAGGKVGCSPNLRYQGLLRTASLQNLQQRGAGWVFPGWFSPSTGEAVVVGGTVCQVSSKPWHRAPASPAPLLQG